jgi:hypothetical protein
MSIPNIQGNSLPIQGLQPVAGPQSNISTRPVSGLLFDRFQHGQVKPDLSVSPGEKLRLALRHPFSLVTLLRSPKPSDQRESFFQRLKMYTTIRKSLDSETRSLFKSLLKDGVLADSRADGGHSTLYHLYSMLTTRRANGYNNQILVKEAVHILGRPYVITQQFAPLSENMARRILQVRNNPGLLSRSVIQAPFKQLTWKDLDVEHGATCVASSLMYYMADKEPAELARHLSELTSPMNAFFEKARLEELSPADPSKAYDVLREHHIKYYVSGPGEVTIRVENPPAGALRAIDSQKVIQNRLKFKTPDGKPSAQNPYQDMRTGIESAYQSALMFLATRTYDPAIDLRDDEFNPGQGSIGLTADEEALMQTIVKDIGGVSAVTYQVVAGKDNPQPGEEGANFLYGYTRSFEQITSDIIESLRMGQPVIIGSIDTEANGSIYSPHVNTITGAFMDPKSHELMFTMADSDDNIPSLVVHSAREIIPKIHHATFPLKIAKRINAEMEANPGYFVPDQQDAARFNLLAQSTEAPPAEQPVPEQASLPDNTLAAAPKAGPNTYPAAPQQQWAAPSNAFGNPAPYPYMMQNGIPGIQPNPYAPPTTAFPGYWTPSVPQTYQNAFQYPG